MLDPPVIPPEVEVVADAKGRVELGWLAPGILYSRSEGVFENALGIRVNAALDARYRRYERVSAFADCYDMISYDAAVRDAFGRLMIEHKRRLVECQVLVRLPAVALGARAVGLLSGGFLRVTTDREDFDQRLAQSVPRLPDWYIARRSHKNARFQTR